MITSIDKIRTLLRQPYKLVLVQQHELERLRILGINTDYQRQYVDNLYSHYVENQGVKTYLS